jgi:hypothetical protein
MDYYSGGNGDSSFNNMDQNISQTVGFGNKFQENSNIILIIFAMIIVALIAGFIIYGVNNDDSKSGGQDTNSSLSSLSVFGVTLEPSFDSKVTQYTIYLDEDFVSDGEIVSFSCKAASSKSKVKGCDEPIDMTNRKKYEHEIIVFAEDTSVTRYYFTTKRR